MLSRGLSRMKGEALKMPVGTAALDGNLSCFGHFIKGPEPPKSPQTSIQKLRSEAWRRGNFGGGASCRRDHKTDDFARTVGKTDVFWPPGGPDGLWTGSLTPKTAS